MNLVPTQPERFDCLDIATPFYVFGVALCTGNHVYVTIVSLIRTIFCVTNSLIPLTSDTDAAG